MTKKVLRMPAGIPLSKAVLYKSKHVLEVSGQIGLDPTTEKLVSGVKEQTVQTLENMKNVLAEVGWDFTNIVKVRVYLTEMKDYDMMNEVYASYFSREYPARIAVAVKELPLGALVEIECTAVGDTLTS